MAAAGIVALAAQFLSDHYAAPVLMALLLGVALDPVSEAPRLAPGMRLGCLPARPADRVRSAPRSSP